MSYTVTREMASELRELIEDTLEYYCDENMVSGELAWLMVQCLAEAKTIEMKSVY